MLFVTLGITGIRSHNRRWQFVTQRWNETNNKYFIYVIIFDVIEMSQRSQPHSCRNTLLAEQRATEREKILLLFK